MKLKQMEALGEACLKQYHNRKSMLNIKDQRIVFWSPTFVLLLDEFTPFLASLRISQDLLWQSLVRTQNCRGQASTSLSKDIERRKLDNFMRSGKLDKRIYHIIIKYWNNGGRELKNYRDLDIHNYAIVRHSFLQISPEEKILVLLPDNPKELKRDCATFKTERDALTYFKDQFFLLHNCIEEIAATLGYSKKPLGQSVATNQLGELEEGTSKTLALMIQYMNGRSLVIG